MPLEALARRSVALYTPESPLRHPRTLFASMYRDLLASRELAWRLLVRDLNAQYRQSLLGITWALLPPLVTAIGFTLASNAGVIRVGATDLPYPAYVMLSMTLWQAFAEALAAPLHAVTSAKPMLARINLPREALLLAKLGELLVNLGIKLLLIVAIFLWFDLATTPRALLGPFALLALMLFGLGIGTLLACLGGLYEDVGKGLPFLSLFWLTLTPVVYPVPEAGVFATLVRLNPVTPLLVTTRELATTGVVSNPVAFVLAVLGCFLALALGWLAFRVSMPFVIERISA